MSYQDDFDRIHRLTNQLGRKLRDDPDVQDALAKLGGTVRSQCPTPLEVECSLDGHRLPPRHTFTAVGYPTLSGEVLEYSPEPIEEGIDLTERIAAGQTKFPISGTISGVLYRTNRDRGTLARLVQESLVDRRRLEKAEWEEQLVARTFRPIHWDFADETLQRIPPHRLEEAMNLHDLVKDVTLPRLGGKPLTAGYLRSFPIAVSPPSAKPAVPDDGRRLMRTLDGTEYWFGAEEAPAARPRTETWTGLNGRLTLEDGTIIPVRDGTLTITHKD